MKPTHNIRQFYAILKDINNLFNIGATKEELVMQFTNGRTSSLTEMSREEFAMMIGDLNARVKNAGDRRQETGDGLDKKRKRLLSVFYELASAAPKVYGSCITNGKIHLEIVITHINSYGCIKKKNNLNEFTSAELSKLISQYDSILLSYYNK